MRLPLRQAAACLTAWRIEPFGVAEHEVGAGISERLLHLRFGGLGVTHEQVGAYGSRKECVALRHVAEVGAQVGCRFMPLTLTVDQCDAAASGVGERQQ